MSKENVGKFWEWYRQHQEITKELTGLEKKGEGAVTKGLVKIGAEMGLKFTEDDIKAVMAKKKVSENLENVSGGELVGSPGWEGCSVDTCPNPKPKK